MTESAPTINVPLKTPPMIAPIGATFGHRVGLAIGGLAVKEKEDE